jgi:hypothetical protein
MYNKKLNEGLEFKDLEGIVKPTVFIDEFASKMGSDDEVSVVSFYVRNNRAADDLVNWFEKGYDFVLDADRSPGEVKPNRYLVYVEMKRRSSLPDWIQELLYDLNTLTEHESESAWTVGYKGEEFPFTLEDVRSRVILSPIKYREAKEAGLNEMRIAAGMKPKSIRDNDSDIKKFAALAGI